MEFLVFAIITFCFFIYGVAVGWKAREKHALRLAEKLLDGLEEQVEKEEAESKVQVTIEKHGDVIYVYDKKSSQFMAQGNSKSEIEDVLSQRFPGKKFAASQEDLEKAGFIS